MADCDTSCPVHRVDLTSGDDAVIRHTPGGEHVTWLAISPDGSRVAALIGHAHVALQLAVVDGDTGDISPVPGIRLGPSGQQPSVVFSPDSVWMAVAVHTELGVVTEMYDDTLEGPYEIPAELGGPVVPVIPMLAR